MALPPLVDNGESSLTAQVHEALKSGILSLAIKPREYLVIGDIATEYGISRTPVREAIIQLEREGWVENDGRRGAKVTAPSVNWIMQIIELQAVLEGYIARRSAELMTEVDLIQLKAVLDEADHDMKIGNYARSRALGLEFHLILRRKVGNQPMQAQIARLEEHVKRVRPMIWDQGEVPIKQASQQHRAIFEAIQAHDPQEAERLMFHHTMWYEKKLATALRRYAYS